MTRLNVCMWGVLKGHYATIFAPCLSSQHKHRHKHGSAENLVEMGSPSHTSSSKSITRHKSLLFHGWLVCLRVKAKKGVCIGKKVNCGSVTYIETNRNACMVVSNHWTWTSYWTDLPKLYLFSLLLRLSWSQ